MRIKIIFLHTFFYLNFFWAIASSSQAEVKVLTIEPAIDLDYLCTLSTKEQLYEELMRLAGFELPLPAKYGFGSKYYQKFLSFQLMSHSEAYKMQKLGFEEANQRQAELLQRMASYERLSTHALTEAIQQELTVKLEAARKELKTLQDDLIYDESRLIELKANDISSALMFIYFIREQSWSDYATLSPVPWGGWSANLELFSSAKWPQNIRCDLKLEHVLGAQALTSFNELLSKIQLPSFCYLPNVLTVLRTNYPQAESYWWNPGMESLSLAVEEKFLVLGSAPETVNSLEFLTHKISLAPSIYFTSNPNGINYGAGLRHSILRSFVARMTEKAVSAIPRALVKSCNLQHVTSSILGGTYWVIKDFMKELKKYVEGNTSNLSAKEQVQQLKRLCQLPTNNGTKILSELTPEMIIYDSLSYQNNRDSALALASTCKLISENPDQWANRSPQALVPYFKAKGEK